MKPLVPPSEDEIIMRWAKIDVPLVSVTIISYNHEKYIDDAVASALSQITDFQFEIIVFDDASFDGTKEIVEQYYKRYPQIIVPLLQRENLWQKKRENGTITIAWPSARGKYIAWLEGDDYWTDPFKLQKQVDFLESNTEYILCFHKVKALVNNSFKRDNVIEKRYRAIADKQKIKTIDLLANNNFIHTCSVVFRKLPISFPFEYGHSSVLDYFLFILLSEKGFLYRIDDYMGVYRRGTGSYSSLSPLEMQKMIIQYHVAILSYLSKEEHRRVFLPKTLEVISEFESLALGQTYDKEKIAEHTGLKDLLRILFRKVVWKIIGKISLKRE